MLHLIIMKEFKELIKKHKKIELEINHLTKLRMNDRAFSSWEKLRKLKKEKLKLKEIVSKFKK
jgi:hypothetical protein